MSLKYRIFLHSYLGFNSNSTLIYGEKDAVLVDASQLLSDSYTLAGEILRMRVNLTHIYVSHFHPDHHFGLQVLHVAFPDATIVALPLSVSDIVATSSDKVDMWAIDRFGPGDIPKATTIPEPLAEPRLELEGEEIVFSGGWEGDSIDNSVVWIPSLKTVLATDVAFHDCNLWPIESNVERRKTWRKDIARLMDFDPRIVIPGHHDAAKQQIIAEVLEDESRTYTDCVEWSIKYLEVYDEAYAAAKTGAELVELMNRYYGDVKAEDFAIHWQARLLFPESSPDWLTPLPGKPGEIFLNPEGGYDGDPPKRVKEAQMQLEGKVALITGGGSGIGAALARRFTAEGATVCITGRRGEKLEEVASCLREGSCHAIPGDVRSEEDTRRIVDEALAISGRLDVLVNNAAANLAGTVVDMDLATWQEMLDTNLTGTFLLMKAAIPPMIAAGGGSIINMGSLAGVRCVPGSPGYCATKAGIIHLTKQVALDYGKDGIRCNSVSPGPVRTEMLEYNLTPMAEVMGTDINGVFEALPKFVPLRRVASPEEIAGLCVYLAGDDSSNMTGTNIMLDGGTHIVDAFASAVGEAGLSWG